METRRMIQVGVRLPEEERFILLDTVTGEFVSIHTEELLRTVDQSGSERSSYNVITSHGFDSSFWQRAHTLLCNTGVIAENESHCGLIELKIENQSVKVSKSVWEKIQERIESGDREVDLKETVYSYQQRKSK